MAKDSSIDLKLTRPHLSAKVMRSYLEHLKNKYPSMDLERICDELGLSLEYLMSEENWVSIQFAEAFTKKLIDVTGNRQLSRQVGKEAVSKKAFGTSLYYLAKYAVSTQLLYENIAKYAPMFNRLLKVQVVEKSHGKISFVYSFKTKALDSEELESLNRQIPEIVTNTISYLESLPTVQDSPPSQVDVSYLNSEGGAPARVLFTINYTAKKPLKRLILGSVAVGSMASLALLFWSGMLSIVSAGSVAMFLVSALCIWLLILNRDLARGIVANERTVQRLNRQYINLQETKESLKRKLDETQLLNTLIRRMASAHSQEEIINQSVKDIKEVLKYDRAVIFLKDEKGEHLEFASASGMSETVIKVLRQFELQIHIPSKDPKKVSNVFNNREGFLVDDVLEHMSSLESDSQEILTFTGSRSFLAAPIATDNEKFGVLCVDFFEQKKQLTEDDLQLMGSVGNQIAVALEKERAQRETIEALQESDRVKDEILATTSHELRTPLHGIIGLAESLRDGDLIQKDPEARSHIEMIMSNGRKLSELVDTILDYSKLLHEDKKIHYSQINLRTLVERTFDLLSSRAERKSLKLINEIGIGFPDIEADEDAIIRVLTNLIDNAIKFTERGHIRVFTEEIESSVTLHVEDTGIGIPRAQLHAVFNAFQQADSSATRSFEGTGLGLTVSKELIQLHGGQIQAESSEGKGSLFSFSLPKKASGKAARKMLSQAPKTKSAQKESVLREPQQQDDSHIELESQMSLSNLIKPKDAKAQILTVDDDLINQQVLTNHLISDSYEVIKAESGPEAISKIRDGLQPDLILMDVMMPGMTGFEATREIRKLLPAAQCPIIFLTARKAERDIVEGIRCGGNDYLAKPFYKNELLARIESHINLARTARAYARFVPWELLKLLGKESIVEVELGDHIQSDMTILFADMRSFTQLSEEKSPIEAFQFLADYLKNISPIVRENGGFIDKFIGDSIMAVFPGGPDDAIHASTQMINKLEELRVRLTGAAKEKIGLAVGINHGPLVLGTLGNQIQMQGTVISDTVNTAARLEALAKQLSCKVLITEEAFSHAKNKEKIANRYLGEVDVKGKQMGVGVVEIFDSDEERLRLLKEASRGELLKLLKNDAPEMKALEKSEQILNLFEKFKEDQTLSQLSNLLKRNQN